MLSKLATAAFGFIWLVVLAGAVVAETIGGSSAAPYTVGSGDVIQVKSFQHDDVSGSYQVADDGTITFPLVGSIRVEGMTASDIAAELERLLEKDFFVDVQLQVEIAQYRSKPIVVLGEIRKPGTHYLKGETTLGRLVADLGGFTSNAGSVLEVRRTEDDDGTLAQRVYTFSSAALMAGGEGSDAEMKAGDIVWVPAKQICFITGEVGKPGRLEIEPGMTLMQALSLAGGQSKFASSVVEVHREVAGEKKILEFDLGDIRKGHASDPPIESGDMIILKRRFF